jgi:hypothetical protein
VFYRHVVQVKPGHDQINQQPHPTLGKGDREERMKDHKTQECKAPSQNYPEHSEEWETLYHRPSHGQKDNKEPRYTIIFQMD